MLNQTPAKLQNLELVDADAIVPFVAMSREMVLKLGRTGVIPRVKLATAA